MDFNAGKKLLTSVSDLPSSPKTSPKLSPKVTPTLESNDVPPLSLPKSNPKAFQVKASSISLVMEPPEDGNGDKGVMPSGIGMKGMIGKMPLVEENPIIGDVSKAIHKDVSIAIGQERDPEALTEQLEIIKSKHTQAITSEFGKDPILVSRLLEVLDTEIDIGREAVQELDSKGSIEKPVSLSKSKGTDLSSMIPEAEPFAGGGNKMACKITGGAFDGQVLLVAQDSHRKIAEVTREMGYLTELQKLGVPTVPILAKGSYDGRPAYVVPYLGLDSKSLVKIEKKAAELQMGATELAASLTPKSIQDLLAIQQAMRKAGIAIEDLQFMIDKKDGSVFLTDPGTILTAKERDFKTQSLRGDEIIGTLIDLAQKFGKKEALKVESDSEDEVEQSPKEIWKDCGKDISAISDESKPLRFKKNRAEENAEQIKILHTHIGQFDGTIQLKIKAAYDFAVREGFIE